MVLGFSGVVLRNPRVHAFLIYFDKFIIGTFSNLRVSYLLVYASGSDGQLVASTHTNKIQSLVASEFVPRMEALAALSPRAQLSHNRGEGSLIL